MELKTFSEWNAIGYRVIKGMKSRHRNEKGDPLFTFNQVDKRRRNSYCYGNLDDDLNDRPEDDPYHGCECF